MSECSCARSSTTSWPSGEMSKSCMSKSGERFVNCRSAPVSTSMSQRSPAGSLLAEARASAPRHEDQASSPASEAQRGQRMRHTGGSRTESGHLHAAGIWDRTLHANTNQKRGASARRAAASDSGAGRPTGTRHGSAVYAPESGGLHVRFGCSINRPSCTNFGDGTGRPNGRSMDKMAVRQGFEPWVQLLGRTTV
jgi:hypothetical protein